MVQIKKQNLNHELYYKTAISTFDLSAYNSNIKFTVGKSFANKLIFVFDRMEKIDYANIPAKVESKKWYYDKKISDDGGIKEISLSYIEGKWLFSNETLSSLDFYVDKVKNKKVIKDLVDKKLGSSIKKFFPPSLSKKYFLLELWQWFGILILFILAFIIEKFLGYLTQVIVNKKFSVFAYASSDHLQKALVPFRRLLFVAILIPGIQYLGLSAGVLNIANRILLILSSIFMVWLGHRIIDMISYYFKNKSLETESKFDDILVPLLTKTTFVILYIVGAIFIAHNFTLDVTSMIAGLGIGGLAFAFAAKDTLANFFGSIMLVLDRPFDIGDVIKAGDLEGIVEEVGFRSTKIRTFYDSIITVSNGTLVNQAIDNFGKRRYRRLSTSLGLEYDTPPEKVEAFCEGIRQIILNHKWTRKDNFNVYFVNFGGSSLDIQLMVFWETPDYAREQAEKHRLMIDILRLANEMEVGFAFPTQTVHLFTENSKNENIKEDQRSRNGYFHKGMELGKKVATVPLSLKNPRSNAHDKTQFGENEF